MSAFLRIANPPFCSWTYKLSLKLKIMPIQCDIINILCTVQLLLLLLFFTLAFCIHFVRDLIANASLLGCILWGEYAMPANVCRQAWGQINNRAREPWKKRNFNPFYDYECTSAYLCKNYAICCRSMPVRWLPRVEEESKCSRERGRGNRRSQEPSQESRATSVELSQSIKSWRARHSCRCCKRTKETEAQAQAEAEAAKELARQSARERERNRAQEGQS